MLNGRAWLAV